MVKRITFKEWLKKRSQDSYKTRAIKKASRIKSYPVATLPAVYS